MTIRAQIIADSVSPEGHRLTTFQLRYPRFIHAELMTHRVFSRNASSSRAIPLARMIEDILRDPAVPIHWGANQRGMQARAELDEDAQRLCLHSWLLGLQEAIKTAETLAGLGLHKQVANRVLEPWAHINVVVTATSWANWFALRDHKDAMPEIAALAQAMKQCHAESEPMLLQPGQWHLPYVRAEDADAILGHHDDEIGDHLLETMKKISVARCARVSYLTHDGRPTSIEKDLLLYLDLVGGDPLHASPAEHQATPDSQHEHNIPRSWDNEHQHGNFVGWRQLRKMLPNEFVADQPYRACQPSTYVAE